MKDTLKLSDSTPTLEDVAKLAGVGRGTAGRALSGQGYVSEQASARIHAAAEKLGYQRNEAARSLKTKRSNAIGIVIPDIGGPFMIACVRGIQKVLRQHEYTSIIVFTDGKEETELEEIEYLIRHQIGGIIIVPANSSAPHFHVPRLRNIPIVSFDQPILNEDYDALLVKNRHSARIAVDHLIGHGHKRIACLGVNGHLYSIRKRMEGYKDAMGRAGLASMLEIVDPENGGIAGQLDRWLALGAPPTAIFSLNELTSVELMQAFSMRRIRMPDRIAFIGFDEIQLGPYLDPPLTTVLQPGLEIGESAATRLLEQIESKNCHSVKHIELEAKLIIRGSCGCHPASSM
jgi:LacI family transcriptional regulator